MFKNYEKQLQYYSMYSGKYNIKDLTVCLCTDITALNERSFYILSDKKKVFEIEYRRMKHRENDYFQKDFVNSGPYLSLEDIKKEEEKKSKKRWVGKRNFSVV